MLKVFVCEDNNMEKDNFTKMIENIIIIENLDMSIGLSTGNPEEILDYLNNNQVTGLYFLDVDLNNPINGIKLAEKIRESDPRGFIVFVTTHAEMSYLTFLYKVEAMDYIIKDTYFNIRARIHECILNANKKYYSKTSKSQENFAIRVEDKVISVKFDDILFFETSRTIHKVILHCKNRQVEFYGKIKDVEDKLDDRFYRCHRSYLINKDNIKEIDENQRIIYMINDEECLVSTRLLNRLKKNIVSLDYY